MSYTCEMIPLSIGGQLRANSFFIFNKFCEGMFRRETECSHFLCFSLLFPIPPSPFSRMGDSFLPFLSFHPFRARVYTIIVCANCLHSFTDGGEELKIRGIGVKAKVKGKSEDIEVKSKGCKGESGRCEVLFCGW